MVGEMPDTDRLVIIGRISSLYGVRGWLKVYSYTKPRRRILDYGPWLVPGAGGLAVEVEDGREHGKGIAVKLKGYDDRDAAARLLGKDIAVRRTRLDAPAPGEYYWADLEGLRVVTRDGRDLGRIDHLLETGANDVVVVRGDRERLIPFVQGQVIRRIDLEAGLMEVDWDPDF